jgi:4-alpha-glucanotransferase
VAVSGVPPDYFAEDGQLWGNPLYDWDAQRRDGFGFWMRRLALQADRFDLLRIDHFRALEAYWSVAAGASSARGGQWLPAPGGEMLARARTLLPQLELVAEDWA